ncbi:MAG: hypothetical protein R3C45_15610 [Phycisphaerales bacterium]
MSHDARQRLPPHPSPNVGGELIGRTPSSWHQRLRPPAQPANSRSSVPNATPAAGTNAPRQNRPDYDLNCPSTDAKTLIRIDNSRPSHSPKRHLLFAPPPVAYHTGIRDSHHPRTYTLGKNITVGPHCLIGPHVTISDNCTLYNRVTISTTPPSATNAPSGPACVIRDRCTIGDRCIIHPNAVIGADGFRLPTR